MPVKSNDARMAELESQLRDDIHRWNEIYMNGCSDPFWPDGVNLNLKRNHIIYDLRQICELQTEPLQVSFFDATDDSMVRTDVINDGRVPPELPMDFMAKPRVCRYFDWENRKQEGTNENHAG